MRIFKKLAALILSLAMICSFAMPAFAEDASPKAPGVSYVFAKFARKGQTPVGISSVTFDAADKEGLKELAIYQELPNGAVGNHYKTLSAVTFTNNDNNVFKTRLFNKPDNGDFEAIEIVPKGNGTETLTAVVEGKEISINITIKNVSASSKEGFYDNKDTTQKYDRLKLESLEPHALYLRDKDGNQIANLKSSEFTYHNKYVNVSINGSGNSFTVQRLLTEGGNQDLIFKRGDLTLVLPLNLPPIIHVGEGLTVKLVGGKASDDGGPYFSDVGFKKEQSSNPDYFETLAICFKIFEDAQPYAIPGGKADGRINLDDPKITYMLKATSTPADAPNPFSLEQLSNGEWFLRYKTNTLGEFKVSFDVTYGDSNHPSKTYTTPPFTITVVEAKEDTITKVAPGESINAALAKLEAKGLDYLLENPQIIELSGGTYNHADDATIMIKIPVTIRGSGRNPDPASLTSTFVHSQLRYELPNRVVSRVTNFVLQGQERIGTGIQANTENHGGLDGNLTVVDFNIGMDATEGQYVMVGGDIENCNIGKSMAVIHPGDMSIIRGSTHFTNNEVAVHIKPDGTDPTRNPFAFGLMYCNFIENKVNVKNESTVPFNFSFNYFDDVSEDKFVATNGALPRNSPYFIEEVRNIANPPVNMRIAQSELEDVQANADALTSDTIIDKTNFTVGTKISIVKPGEEVATLSGWEFTSISNNPNSPEFKPAIVTKLKSSSSNAVDTLPSGATYQPVSFAHSGALPGTATVNVAKDADAPTQNLKLYKVVGNKLVLQPEAVTFANGEYIFQRDGASDYLITDTDVTGSNDDDDDDDDSSGGSGGSGGSNDYVGSEEINNKLESTTGSNVSISVAGKPIVSASLFDTLKTNPGKTITLKGDGYAWSFKGSDIKGNIPGLISFNTKISSTSPNAEEIKKVTGDAEIVNVYFSYHGQLPGRATVDLAVDKKYNGKTLNFYHYNAAKKQLETVATGLAVKDGKVSVSITHCSDYILSPVALKATAPVTQMVTNPETGAVDRVPLAIAFAALSCLGALAILRAKKPE